MRILVTGGAGFVGSHVVRSAVSAGHDVLNFDLLTAAANLSGIWDLENAPNYCLVPGDIRDLDILEKTLRGFEADLVIHLAQCTPYDMASEFWSTHVIGTQNVMRACKGAGVRKILFSHYISRQKNGLFNMSKKASETIFSDLNYNNKLKIINSFSPSIFGVGQSPIHPISIVIDNLLKGRKIIIPKGPHVAMDLISVEDHAKALLSLLTFGFPNTKPTYLLGLQSVNPMDLAHQICRSLQSCFPKTNTRFQDLLDIRDSLEMRHLIPYYAGNVTRGTTPFRHTISDLVQWHVDVKRQDTAIKSQRIRKVA